MGIQNELKLIYLCCKIMSYLQHHAMTEDVFIQKRRKMCSGDNSARNKTILLNLLYILGVSFN